MTNTEALHSLLKTSQVLEARDLISMIYFLIMVLEIFSIFLIMAEEENLKIMKKGLI